MPYPAAFKSRMVQRMVGPSATSAQSLSSEVGVHQTTLSKWLREASRVTVMKNKKTVKKSGAKRLQDWTSAEKLELVLEASGLGEIELGALLRQRGVNRSQLERWRQQMLSGLEKPPKKPSKNSPETRKIRELERELRHKDKALAEASALLVLKKKSRRSGGTRTTTHPGGARNDRFTP